MTIISSWGAIELAQQIEQAYPELKQALREVNRLRDLLINIVDICNTDRVTWDAKATVADYDKTLTKIDDIAHGYFKP
jgi:hypothetical protein